MDWLQRTLYAFWQLSSEMAPYLLLGFACASLLRLFVSDATVKRHLGQRGWRQTVKASVLGVPLPLCSCGIIPVAASLKQQGGSRGAVASFTASTPQTGVDSILATGAMLSWPFALIRVIVAFISGVFAGTLVDQFGEKKDQDADVSKKPDKRSCCCEEEPPPKTSCCSKEPPATSCCSKEPPATSCCSGEEVASSPKHDCCSKETTTSPKPSIRSRVREALHFGFIRLPGDVGLSLLVGLLLAGLLTALLPSDLTQSQWTRGVLAYAITTLAAIPLYVCSTGSIPMAYALIHAGFSPGAALIFLIAGPATNTATIVALTQMLGLRSVALYLAAIIGTAWVSAATIDLLGNNLPMHGSHEMQADLTWWGSASAIIMLGLIFWERVAALKSRTAAANSSS